MDTRITQEVKTITLAFSKNHLVDSNYKGFLSKSINSLGLTQNVGDDLSFL
jgi:hypothetical protein